jgi:hypothetical protein
MLESIARAPVKGFAIEKMTYITSPLKAAYVSSRLCDRIKTRVTYQLSNGEQDIHGCDCDIHIISADFVS